VALAAGALGVVAGVGTWLTWPVRKRSSIRASGASLNFSQQF
jgi:hypothetical protein